MKKLVLLLIICLFFSCKKDADKTLTEKKWLIASSTVSPAITIGNKTSSDYLALMGNGSCEASAILTFSKDGTFTEGSNGALCDLYADPTPKNATKWSRDGSLITLSSMPGSPLLLSDHTLTRTGVTTMENGRAYTFVRVYKQQ